MGFHVGIAGGLDLAPERAHRLGARAMQLFTRSPRSWQAPPLNGETAVAFRQETLAHGLLPVAHAIYLINLASPDEELRARSVAAFSDEIERCARLGIDRVVIHPGSHGLLTRAQGLRQALRSLKECTRRTRTAAVTILLETTSGAGRQLGGELADLAWMIDHHPEPERLGVCFDSCHLFAAGRALHEPDGLDRLLAETEKTIGLGKLGCWHLNDSLGDWNSHRDRHARIGRGKLGRDFFRRLLADERLFGVPKILEVPGGDEAFAADLRLLARLAPRG
ncbi:MAG: deoxyribonuclease IV [Myxococcales bacterium]|nr:deoxyribonuclease IV [Myxococcales bacterium]